MKEYICIDIGGTSIKYGMIRENGEFLTTGEMPTEAKQDGGPGNHGKGKKNNRNLQGNVSPRGNLHFYSGNGRL